MDKGDYSISGDTQRVAHKRNQVCYTEDRRFWDKIHQDENIASRQS